MSITRKNVIKFLIIFFIFSSCHTNESDLVIVRVGKRGISYNDLQTLVQINKIQPGYDTSFFAASIYYVKALKYAYLADSLGYPITQSILLTEAQRIHKQTHMPSRLEIIKQVCGDTARYLRLFVFPQLAQRWLLYHFKWDTSIHQNSRLKASHVLSLIKDTLPAINLYEALSGVGLKMVALRYHLKYELYKINIIEGIQSIQKKKFAEKAIAQPKNTSSTIMTLRIENRIRSSIDEKNSKIVSDLINKVLKKLKVGQIYNLPVELEDSFWIVQLIDYYKYTYYIAVVQVPKIDFFTWFETESKKIPVIYSKP